MKFLVNIDLEGCAGVVGEANLSLTASKDYDFAKEQGAREANAAIKALFESGASEVIVWDAHGSGLNLNSDALDQRAKIIKGSGWKNRMEIVDDTFSGVLFIGYHSKDNVAKAVLSHTFNSGAFQYIKINGQEVGEIEVDAAILGDKKVPVIFVSSDKEACQQAKKALPWIQTCQTKEALGHNMALSLHPKQACQKIYEGVKKAVSRMPKMELFTLPSPIDLEIRFKRIEDAENDLKYRKYASQQAQDAYSVCYTLDKLSSYF